MFKAIAIATSLALTLSIQPAGAQVLQRSAQYAAMCANVLNFTPRILRREAVAAIRPDAHVIIHWICQGVPFNDSGNASGLTRTIAANKALNSALRARGWTPDDVVALAIHGNTVDAYVYRFIGDFSR